MMLTDYVGTFFGQYRLLAPPRGAMKLIHLSTSPGIVVMVDPLAQYSDCTEENAKEVLSEAGFRHSKTEMEIGLKTDLWTYNEKNTEN